MSHDLTSFYLAYAPGDGNGGAPVWAGCNASSFDEALEILREILLPSRLMGRSGIRVAQIRSDTTLPSDLIELGRKDPKLADVLCKLAGVNLVMFRNT